MTQTLYLMVGYPGSGKTTTARIIAELTGAVHLWADKERHLMFGQPTHSRIESKKLYSYLDEVVDKLLSEGKGVIFDTNFNFKKDRDLLRQIAIKHRAETKVIWVKTPKEIAKQRAVHDRTLRNGYAYKLTEKDFNRMANNLQPPTDEENITEIDGTEISEDYIKERLRV